VRRRRIGKRIEEGVEGKQDLGQGLDQLLIGKVLGKTTEKKYQEVIRGEKTRVE